MKIRVTAMDTRAGRVLALLNDANEVKAGTTYLLDAAALEVLAPAPDAGVLDVSDQIAATIKHDDLTEVLATNNVRLQNENAALLERVRAAEAGQNQGNSRG